MGLETVYVFGNEHISQDNFALQVAKKIRKRKIRHCYSPEEIFEDNKPAVIIDVVKGAKKPLLIDDVSALKTRKILSMHDFDLAFFIRLMEEMGINKKIRIIGVPERGDAAKAAKEVLKWI
mgnify:CR=1 FL=1